MYWVKKKNEVSGVTLEMSPSTNLGKNSDYYSAYARQLLTLFSVSLTCTFSLWINSNTNLKERGLESCCVSECLSRGSWGRGQWSTWEQRFLLLEKNYLLSVFKSLVWTMPLKICFNFVSPELVRLGQLGLDDRHRSLPAEILVAFLPSQYC